MKFSQCHVYSLVICFVVLLIVDAEVNWVGSFSTSITSLSFEMRKTLPYFVLLSLILYLACANALPTSVVSQQKQTALSNDLGNVVPQKPLNSGEQTGHWPSSVADLNKGAGGGGGGGAGKHGIGFGFGAGLRLRYGKLKLLLGGGLGGGYNRGGGGGGGGDGNSGQKNGDKEGKKWRKRPKKGTEE